MAVEAQHSFEGYTGPIPTDVTTVIFERYHNPGRWNGPVTRGTWACKTLGRHFTPTIACWVARKKRMTLFVESGG